MMYDEYSKILLSDIKCAAYGAGFGTALNCKISLNVHGYSLFHWADEYFSACIVMDFFSALSARLLVRRKFLGDLLCGVHGYDANSRIDVTELLL